MASFRAVDTKNIHTIPKLLDIMFEEPDECDSLDGNGSRQQIGVNDVEVNGIRARHLPGFISPNAFYLNHNLPFNKYYPPLITKYPAHSLPLLCLRKWRNSPPKEVSRFVVVQPGGLVSMFPQCNTRVNITVDGAVRVYNKEMGISLAVNAEGNKAGMVHPMGCVYQDKGDKVYVTTWDSKFSNRYAKIWQHGVIFTHDMSHLTYVTDSTGTRITTDDLFGDLLYDFTKPILMDNSKIGDEYTEICKGIVDSVQYSVLNNGGRKWIANNIRVVKSADGVVEISRDENSINLKITEDGKTSISTPHVYCTASNGHSKHLCVRKDKKRVHFDGQTFMVGKTILSDLNALIS